MRFSQLLLLEMLVSVAWLPGEGLAEDVRAAESLLQRVVDWDGHFTEGEAELASWAERAS